MKSTEQFEAVLINPPKDNAKDDYYTEFLPLNLIAIATRLRLAGVKTELIDTLPGERGTEEIKRSISEKKGDLVVGISLYQTNEKQGLEIANFCRQIQEETGRKIQVIIGGVNVTVMGPHYMKKYPGLFDGAVIGHGEDAMVEICQGGEARNVITNETLAANRRVIPFFNTDLDKGFPYDYDDLNLEEYWQFSDKRFSSRGSRYSAEDLNRPLLINTHRGCYLSCSEPGERIVRCSFCGHPEFTWKGINPKQFWGKLQEVMDSTGANCISDLGDNFVGNTTWFKELARNRPNNFPYPFKYIFASSDKLCDEKIVRLLAEKFGVHAVLNSVEHGDDRCQTAFGKAYTPEQTLKSLKLLEKYKIASRLSFVIGAPRTGDFEGESKETLKRFLEYAKQLADLQCIQVILGNILVPSPGSKIWKRMMKEGENRALYHEMLPTVDLTKITEDFFREFTQISREEADCTMEKIMDLFPEDVIKGDTV